MSSRRRRRRIRELAGAKNTDTEESDASDAGDELRIHVCGFGDGVDPSLATASDERVRLAIDRNEICPRCITQSLAADEDGHDRLLDAFHELRPEYADSLVLGFDSTDGSDEAVNTDVEGAP